jgi:hypothetical protein
MTQQIYYKQRIKSTKAGCTSCNEMATLNVNALNKAMSAEVYISVTLRIMILKYHSIQRRV